MGNASAGKTMLIKSFLEGRDQKTSKHHYTVTIQDFYKAIVIEDEDGEETKINLTIWDAAGD